MRTFLLATALLAVLALSVSAADTTQPSDQAKGTITGKVLHDGKPMPGMRVAVFDAAELRRGRKNKGDAGNDAAEKGAEEKGAGGVNKIFGKDDRPKPVAQTVTDADGAFTLELPAGAYFVAASGKKIGMAHERVEVKAGESVTVDLPLQDRGVRGKKGASRAEKSPSTQPV
jgi:opacity protein-like surface antigen